MLTRFRGSFKLSSNDMFNEFTPKFEINQLLVYENEHETKKEYVQASAFLNLKFIDQIRTFEKYQQVPKHFHHVGRDVESLEEVYERRKVTSYLSGGLGNRLFQMGAVVWFADKYHRTPVVSLDKIEPCNHSLVNYTTSIFAPFCVMTAMSNCHTFIERPENFSHFIEWEDVPEKDVCFRGYFQSYHYVKNHQIDKYLSLDRPPLVALLQAAFIHVRRGDYVNNAFHEINLNVYYLECMRRAFVNEKAPLIIVLSNDIEWCKNQWMFQDQETIRFCQEEKGELIDLSIMARCAHGGICSNSSFSWWGSFLGQGSGIHHKTYIPSKWLGQSQWTTQLVDPLNPAMEEVNINSWFLPITYFNLKHRTDRNMLIQWELKTKLGIGSEYIERFDAIYVKDRGHQGCCASHIQGLQNFIDSKCPLGLLFEDDAELEINLIEKLVCFFKELTGPHFDGLLLGGGEIQTCTQKQLLDVKTNKLELKRFDFTTADQLVGAQQTVGYIITRHQAKKLVSLWSNCLLGLSNKSLPQHNFCIDQSWKQLHKLDAWFVSKPLLCKQRISFSDIEKTIK